jgi:hypothetical protein
MDKERKNKKVTHNFKPGDPVYYARIKRTAVVTAQFEDENGRFNRPMYMINDKRDVWAVPEIALKPATKKANDFKGKK